MKKLIINTILFVPIIALVSCAFVSLDPQAQDVTVSPNTESLSKCKSLGSITVSVWAKAEDFQSQETMKNQLDILARNQAAKINGNTVFPDSEIDNGQRAYKVYDCPISQAK